MRHACAVNAPRVAVISFLGGAVSVLPFDEDWFGLGGRAPDVLLIAALTASAALGIAIHFSARLQRLVALLAGPPTPRARALVLVAVFAGAGIGTMVVAAALAGS